MGHFSRICIALGLLALSLGWAGHASAAPEGPYYVKGTRVNLRQAPAGEVLLELAGGEKLFVIERDAEWCHVSLPGLNQRGWIHGDFVAAPAATLAQAEGDVTEAAPSLASSEVTDVLLPGQDTAGIGGVRPETRAITSSASAPERNLTASFKDVALTSPGKLGSVDYRSVAGPELASISAANVNLRESASLSAKVVGKVEAGQRAFVIANNDPWCLVSLPEANLKGWVFGEYVDIQPRVAIKADNVRLREGPSLEARVKEQLARGDVFYKVDARDGWVQVASSASGLSGWVKAEYTVRSTDSVSRPYTISGDQVNFRASPSIDGEIIGRLPLGATVNVLGRNEKWAYAYFEGHKGWLYTEYLSPVGQTLLSTGRETQTRVSAPPATLSWKQAGGTPVGSRLIERARAMMGTPYVWGGESEGGVDCSGLIYKLLCDEGCDVKCLPRRASEQMAQLGLSVEKEELAPGDLVFFTTYKAGPSHVGIYLGDGDFIHASSAQRRVTVSNLSEGYYRERFVGARRLTEEEIKGLQ